MRREKFKDGPSYTCWGKLVGDGVRRKNRENERGKTENNESFKPEQSSLRPEAKQKSSQATGQC